MGAENKDMDTASQTLIAKIKLHGPATQVCLSLMSLLECAHFKANQLTGRCSAGVRQGCQKKLAAGGENSCLLV